MQSSKFIKNKELSPENFMSLILKKVLYHKVRTSTLTISVQQQ